ncbi:DUF305 domain-containing protein [Stenomitos frigidus]|uniref:DUF305 domain-containing protein n=1 Tax=Stenomitos frigidus ULC18 TaxID=2107698 RepID=A0A2T1DWU8_9CYAN|nr:DUF305 domain-containing protein [Stenomitos frigidus]PSB24942.1 DUF305 domain-containing protein [Stenomitos frigidus ULC18]
MNKKSPLYSLTGLLAIGALTGTLLVNRTQAQSPNADQPAPPPQSGMMAPSAQHFIEMMIPHHQDAVEMANLALARAKHPELKTLAVAIKRDQTREIQQMRGWYKAWYGKEVPATAMMNGSGMMGNQGMMGSQQGTGQGMMGGSGMMGNQQGMGQGMMTRNGMMRTDLTALKNAPDFDKEFLRQMIPHHQMAVHMAQMVQNQKTRPEIRTLAQSILKSQTAEIKQMQQWQKAW